MNAVRMLSLVLLALWGWTTGSGAGWPFDVAHGTQPAQPLAGITYIERVDAEPRPVWMHVAQIDLQAPGIRFKVSPPGGDREVLRQSTVDFLKQERAQLGINGHF